MPLILDILVDGHIFEVEKVCSLVCKNDPGGGGRFLTIIIRSKVPQRVCIQIFGKFEGGEGV